MILLDLTELPEDYLPRQTSFLIVIRPDLPSRTPRSALGFERARHRLLSASRPATMLNQAGERTLLAAIYPPETSAIYMAAFVDFQDHRTCWLCSRLRLPAV